MIENNRLEFMFDKELINVGDNVGKENIELSKTQEKIIMEISKNNNITQKELAKILKVNERTIQRNTVILQEKGLLKRIGPAFGGHWEVIK
ncbi:MAG: HTH domain-containing protein [Bacillota bacterium]|nr:HTH domain-containing protein [Bacillota bacterium]